MIRNFLFHRVNPQRDRLWDPMDVSHFEKCIKYISTRYEVLLIEDVVFSEKLNTKNQVATIMFDDGYKDNIEYAAPILAKYKCKASFYVVTECIDKNIPTWTHILEHLFQFTNNSRVAIDFGFLPADLRAGVIDGREERIAYVKKLKPFLKTISHENRNLVVDRVLQSFSDIELPKLMMNWNDLKELKGAGHYIGSHTVSHSMLGTMSNEQEILDELTHSGNRIKDELGHFPLTISYPVGSFNETTKSLAQKAGYKIGLAVKQDIFTPERDGLFEIARIELYNENWLKTKFRITNTLENFKKLIRYR